ncbi:hypothetical protein MKW98_011532 [Papaver atlanticum]|uniref:Uncharacterized protein n=1 Tax=Papaver atlanticum TaxID=357466 RepID=A0AAD4S846_9MAGN|nr:hypothetical protein MKW98_011532 [Papaver atlanticum]
MGLLENFWDDTLAGPRPENGLKKLRQYDSGPLPSFEDVPVSRSITIPKNNYSDILRVAQADSSPSSPSSPAGSSTPGSPFSSWTTARDTKKLMRMKSTSAASERAEPRIPTVYDWMVISAIDR